VKVRLLALLLAAVAWSSSARAETHAEAYAAARAALSRGAANDAIDRLELLADQGVVNADASELRAAAYLARAEGNAAAPGDLGRAAAALGEALLLRPGDAELEHAIEAVQAEIARRRPKSQDNVVVRPRLARAIAGLFSEQLWAGLALACAVAVSAGIVLRRVPRAALPRLAGTVVVSVGSALGLGFAAGAYAAAQFRTNSRPAVVVVPEARLTQESGRPLLAKRGADTTSVAEGSTVYVLDRREGRCLVEWGSTEGWLRLDEVRLLATR
jgi:hypothetical protein